ncbi:MAG: hypothetical protein H8K04_00240 [Nitrospira sp.]
MNARKRTNAPHGEKTIAITIRLFTNSISRKKGRQVKRECWDVGTVYMHQNLSHGISASKPIPFHSLMDLSSKIELLITRQKIKLHPGNQSRKYIYTQ